MVGASHIIHALAEHRVVPRSGWLATRARDGELRRALAVTTAIALAALALRELNVVAPVITLFFLITYGTINLVVLVEQGLDLTSFRPRLQPPMVVPALGFLGCLAAMVVVNAMFAVVALIVVIGIAALLARQRLDTPVSDARPERRAQRAVPAAVALGCQAGKVGQAVGRAVVAAELLVPTRAIDSLTDVTPFMHDITTQRQDRRVRRGDRQRTARDVGTGAAGRWRGHVVVGHRG